MNNIEKAAKEHVVEDLSKESSGEDINIDVAKYNSFIKGATSKEAQDYWLAKIALTEKDKVNENKEAFFLTNILRLMSKEEIEHLVETLILKGY